MFFTFFSSANWLAKTIVYLFPSVTKWEVHGKSCSGKDGLMVLNILFWDSSTFDKCSSKMLHLNYLAGLVLFDENLRDLFQDIILCKNTNRPKTFSFPFCGSRCRDRSYMCEWKCVHAGKSSDFVSISVWMTMTGFDNKLSVRRYLTFATGLVECLCFAGAVFGWASLVFVVKEEGYFSSLCVNTTVNGTQTLGVFHASTLNSEKKCFKHHFTISTAIF